MFDRESSIFLYIGVLTNAFFCAFISSHLNETEFISINLMIFSNLSAQLLSFYYLKSY